MSNGTVDTGTLAKRKLEQLRDDSIESLKKDVAKIEGVKATFWRTIAFLSVGMLISAIGFGAAINSYAGDIKKGTKAAEEAAENARRIEKVEEAVLDHADHLAELIAGQRAIAEAVGAKLPPKKIRVKGAR